jgi:hypothetical protein
MGRSNTKRKQHEETILRYYRRYGFPRDRNNQALPQVLHLWEPTDAAARIKFRAMRRRLYKFHG